MGIRLPLEPAPKAFRRRLAAFSLVLGLAVPALPGEVAAADPVIVAAGDIAVRIRVARSVGQRV